VYSHCARVTAKQMRNSKRSAKARDPSADDAADDGDGDGDGDGARPSASAPAARDGGGGGGPRGWVLALRPTPELWAAALPHRTQIVQPLDAALAVFELGVRPGDVCIESGTGSGAMSAALCRALAPDGALHTFEFNETRAAAARKEFGAIARALGTDCARVEHRDVCAAGFGAALEGRASAAAAADGDGAGESASAAVDGATDDGGAGGAGGAGAGDGGGGGGVADAIFLDLPEPWRAVPHAARALKRARGRLCSYSPCIEQTMRTCDALRAAGFHSIRTIEARLCEADVKRLETPPLLELAAAQPQPYHAPAAPRGAADADDGGPRKRARVGAERAEHEMLAAKANERMRGHTAFLTFADL